jgi:hypothetical protein
MKDIYDILFLASHQAFDMNLLHKAIAQSHCTKPLLRLLTGEGLRLGIENLSLPMSLNLQKKNRRNGQHF